MASIDGWWIATDGEIGGVPLPTEALTDLAFRFQNGRFYFGADDGWVVIHPSAQPATLDLVLRSGPNRGRVVPGIVELTPSSLRLCCDLSGRARPGAFCSPVGSRRFLAMYERASSLAEAVVALRARARPVPIAPAG